MSVIRFKGFSIACDAAAGRRDQHWQESAGGAPGRAGEKNLNQFTFSGQFSISTGKTGLAQHLAAQMESQVSLAVSLARLAVSLARLGVPLSRAARVSPVVHAALR